MESFFIIESCFVIESCFFIACFDIVSLDIASSLAA